jgi:hypothetical protein
MIQVSDDDPRQIAQAGYEGAASSNRDQAAISLMLMNRYLYASFVAYEPP